MHGVASMGPVTQQRGGQVPTAGYRQDSPAAASMACVAMVISMRLFKKDGIKPTVLPCIDGMYYDVLLVHSMPDSIRSVEYGQPGCGAICCTVPWDSCPEAVSARQPTAGVYLLAISMHGL